MARETNEVVIPIRLYIGEFFRNVRMFRNNVGRYKDGHGNYVTYGLGPGTSDLVGWESVLITPDLVGKIVPIFTAIECKRADARTDRRRLEQQTNFISAVRNVGGLGGFATSINEACEILNQRPGIHPDDQKNP